MTKHLNILVVLLLIVSYASFAQQYTQVSAEATKAEVGLSFREIPNLKAPYINVAPINRNDGIAVGKLNIKDSDLNAIKQFCQELSLDKHGNYDALLISHKNKLVFESYFKKGRIDLPHGQASATKGYTSLILGRAMQLGYLTMDDLQKPLISFLKNIDTKKIAKGSENITLHKALTMQGGLTIDRDKWKDIEKDSVRLKGQELVQTLLEESAPITSETQTYLYGNFNPMLVMTVIDAVTPDGAEAFIKSEFLDKLGISNYEWSTYVSGLPVAGSSVRMLSRDMLKLGSLVLNNGRWNGEQFIPEDYLVKATSSIVNPKIDWMPKDYRYGYFWYHKPIIIGTKTYDAKLAWGGGGQRVIVVKELDLIIAVSGHDREDKIMPQISKIVIPAFVE